MTCDEALDTLDRVYHSPLVPVVRAEVERLRADLAAARADAERYRWLRKTLHESVGGGVEVNDAALVYEKSEPGENVRVYWYPDTPVGFYELKAESLDAAIDAALAGEKK